MDGIPLKVQDAITDVVPYGFAALPQAELQPHEYTWKLEPMLEAAEFTAEDQKRQPGGADGDDEAVQRL